MRGQKVKMFVLVLMTMLLAVALTGCFSGDDQNDATNPEVSYDEPGTGPGPNEVRPGGESELASKYANGEAIMDRDDLKSLNLEWYTWEGGPIFTKSYYNEEIPFRGPNCAPELIPRDNETVDIRYPIVYHVTNAGEDYAGRLCIESGDVNSLFMAEGFTGELPRSGSTVVLFSFGSDDGGGVYGWDYL